MAKDIQKLISVRPAYQVNRGPVKLESGLATKYVASAIFDTAGLDSSGVSNKTTASHGTGVYIPTGAIITNVFFDVQTTFTSTNDSATIAATLQSAGDLKAAIAISAAGDVWDAGIRGSVLGNAALDGNATTAIVVAASQAASMIKLTAEREIVFTVATQALLTGKCTAFVEYIVSNA